MFSNMLVAEKRLLEACKKGELLILSDNRPFQKTDENEIRGEFLRHLILSNNQEIVEKDGIQYILKINSWGINIIGAYISGIFDFSYCETNISSKFLNSVFENKIDLMYSKIDSLYFSDTKTKSINGQGLICLNNIFFDDYEIEGELDFSFSEIRNLGFSNGNILNQNGNAFNCISAIIKGNISFSKNKIHGNLILSLSKIDNLLNLSNLDLIGNIKFESTKTNTINIEGSKFWEEGLTEINLDGLEYNHLSVTNSDFKVFINLLKKMPKFKPQPYKQLSKVLRNMGHNEDADDIMIEYKNKSYFGEIFKIFSLLFKKDIYKYFKSIFIFFGNIFMLPIRIIIFITNLIYWLTAGYGYKPMRVVGTMLVIWLSCGWFYQKTADVAVFAPSNPLVFQHKEYKVKISDYGTPNEDFSNSEKYMCDKKENECNNWTKSQVLQGEYTTFSPYWYSLDILLPIVDLQMDEDWGVFISPINSDITLNHATRWIVWIEILLGWIYSLILVAILSGLAKNEKD